MDWKSIVLNKRMKFFFNITLISSYLFLNWAYPCDAQGILKPSHLLSSQYSMLHNLQPRNADPNIAYPVSEIPVVEYEMNDLSISLPKYLYSKKEDIQHAYGYDLCLQPLLEYGHFLNYISESTHLGNDFEYLLLKHCSDILSPKLDGNSNCLSNVNSFGSLTSNKTKTFIETKVTAMKLQGFNL